MRAIAILIVVASHFGLGNIIPGNFGVTIFFCISGFIITRLLLVEAAESDAILIGAFYARRFIRLLPALIFMITATSAGYWLLKHRIEASEIFAAFFYYKNYHTIFGGSQAMPFGPLWSLAVEEHYYLIFPAVVFSLCRSPRAMMIALCMTTAAALIWRFILCYGLNASESYTHLATDTRLDSILYGVILATVMHYYPTETKRLDSIPIAIVCCLALILTFAIRSETFRETWRYSIQGLALVPLIYIATFGRSTLFARKILAAPILVWIGLIELSRILGDRADQAAWLSVG